MQHILYTSVHTTVMPSTVPVLGEKTMNHHVFRASDHRSIAYNRKKLVNSIFQ